MQKNKGFFIAIEGVDGSGKTEVMRRLREEFPDFVCTREPGGTPVAELTRNVILAKETGESSRTVQALLFAAARRDHVEKLIMPKLDEGKVVITDRYFLSSLSYQFDSPDIYDIIRIGTAGLHPDLTIILDVDYETAQKRLIASGKITDHLDNEGEQSFESRRRIMKAYHKHTYPGLVPVRSFWVYANNDKDEVYKSVKAILGMFLDSVKA